MSLSAGPSASPLLTRPSFLLFLADDVGYGDLASYGHPLSSTPALDQLAQSGVRLTQFYAAAPECSPSRAGLLTGRLPLRNGAWSNQSNSATDEACGINNRNDSLLKCNDQVFAEDRGLPLSERTLAELLAAEGYLTGACGKWNLGETAPHLPTARGFHSYFGLPFTTIDCASDTNPRPTRTGARRFAKFACVLLHALHACIFCNLRVWSRWAVSMSYFHVVHSPPLPWLHSL